MERVGIRLQLVKVGCDGMRVEGWDGMDGMKTGEMG